MQSRWREDASSQNHERSSTAEQPLCPDMMVCFSQQNGRSSRRPDITEPFLRRRHGPSHTRRTCLAWVHVPKWQERSNFSVQNAGRKDVLSMILFARCVESEVKVGLDSRLVPHCLLGIALCFTWRTEYGSLQEQLPHSGRKVVDSIGRTKQGGIEFIHHAWRGCCYRATSLEPGLLGLCVMHCMMIWH